MRAVGEAGVPALLYSSSVGVYSPGPKDRYVDESWPRDGVATSHYGRQKAEVERRLDRFEAENEGVRVIRVRPALVFKREAAEGIRRLFGGPFFPSFLARPELINYVPRIENLRAQVIHSYDVGEAFRLALVNDGRARAELGWTPRYDAEDALLDALEGLRTGAGLDTPPLSPRTSGPMRIREILTGVGRREP
jgi:nucleoside-diphosphate-sugar epimerase